MSAKYFEIKDDPERVGRWFLRGPRASDGTEVNPSLFTLGTRVEVSNSLFIPQRVAGDPLDFTFADCLMPVVGRSGAEAILALGPGDVQMIPAKVEGRKELHYVVNVLAVEDCFNHETSKYDLWTEADNNPRMTGQIFGVYELRVLQQRVGKRHMFRIKGWTPPIIVSEELRRSLEALGTSGVFFEEVE